jgi:hypothetical protein
MTVIVYRDGVMASDTMGSRANIKAYGFVKMAVGVDGAVHGGSGDWCKISKYMDWVRGGYVGECPAPEANDEGSCDFHVLIADAGGCSVLTHKGREPSPEYAATGSGLEIAYGALFMGASAADAVRAAIHHADGCGGEVVEMRVGDVERTKAG